ncbi:Mth938-like domain-containing protein [Algihabitans albus]|uniref:Mth938-like domain-containing protein n=1 Tax=Algihabitans albus TaxID=2164067 RepID=UPI000E5C6940|nr:Mth938-like domain-containing protein [Algihabitans albus]
MKEDDLTSSLPEGRQLVEGYGPGRFTVAGQLHEGALLLTMNETSAWAVGSHDEITLESLAFILDKSPSYEVLLIGTGAKSVLLPKALRSAIREKGPVAECMGTGAAARTFNLLQTEGRRVAAALIAV